MYPQLEWPVFGAYAHERVRVAYLSADVGEHPVSQLLVGVLEKHDRQRFETLLVCLESEDGSALGKRMRGAVDRVLEVRRDSDASVARQLRELEVDIVVDLQGMTQGMRAEILARRPAPIQVSYLGFAATMGAPYIDYIIADSVVIPAGAEAGYSEQIARLPQCFLPFDNTQSIAERVPTRAEAGLPESGLVFCDFNNHIKITPPVFDVWMRLLKAIPDSCLWLRWAAEDVTTNLRREAQARGVDPQRLIFAVKVPTLAEHLARQRLADLFLDTFPYNAHATAAQALWAGVPVLTCQGQSFASRVAASLLHACGMPQLITDDLQQYEHRALSLARDPEQLLHLRQTLASNLRTAPLFDTELYTRDLEGAFLAMVERQRAGLPPTHMTLHAQDAETLAAHGMSLFDTGDLEDAERHCRRALALAPRCLSARVTLGNIAVARQQYDQALEHFRTALAVDEHSPAARSNIGSCLYALGRTDEALAAFEKLLQYDPHDALAQHMVAALKGTGATAPPSAYIRDLFDSYAADFERHLVGTLAYRTPEVLAALLGELRPESDHTLDVLDLGCGTGLAGVALRPWTRSLVGVDLSAGMLERARRRGIYERLCCEELLGFLRAEPDARYDLVVAADVFVYLGELDSVVAETRRVLRPEGILLFSVELLDAREDQDARSGSCFGINATGRYAHASEYLSGLAASAHFTPMRSTDSTLRLDHGTPIAGRVVAWMASGPMAAASSVPFLQVNAVRNA
jgi:predicted O-linked N-acetylglucosamine transferase (SPINDLY family)/SAM-dependent methyltransferase